ncbi:hypothetical protein BDV25DRAFT_141215 [Aspergillus avenaceus]|uniref:DUF1772-domain-containing protein n=1 Tax=Aspergillus avenaceus TaxID=36643 RepID=A0A5N6TSF8_ASPAV|nr:hypothetical protein BDV25DRAFT_141215 [Aspergillus avenaceus]
MSFPVGFRFAQAVGLTGATWLSGKIISLSVISVPALIQALRQNEIPPDAAAKLFRRLYNKGKATAPPVAAATSGAFLYCAWAVRTGTALAPLTPSNGSSLYCAAAALTLGIVPYTLGLMISTNNKLMDKAESKSAAAKSDEIESLLSRWLKLNAVRGVLPLFGGIIALVAARCLSGLFSGHSWSRTRVLTAPKTYLRGLVVHVRTGPHIHGRTASTDALMDPHRHHHVVKVEGPHDKTEQHRENLIVQLNAIPPGTVALRVEEENPSDEEWTILGSYFPNIQSLEMDTGFNEDLQDKEMPLHWPLMRYRLSSACEELFQSPHVRQGRVNHLILLLTSGLRFEGPTSKELVRRHKEAISRGEVKAKYLTVKEGTPEERKIELTSIPELVNDWLNNKYTAEDPQLEEDNHAPSTVNLRTLEILENDAIDTFNRMAMALPHLVENLTTLNLRSTHGLDFHFTSEKLFPQILPQLSNLQTLQLSIGEVFDDDSLLPALYTWLPPNLSRLQFRGPASLTQSEKWEDWVQAFSSETFLPHLKHLSFTLDLHYEPTDNSWGKNKKERIAPEHVLHSARAAVEPLYEAARQRGIAIARHYDTWSDECQILRQVDDRWLC